MRKNKIDHKGLNGIRTIASGYAINAKPVPLLTTSFTFLPNSLAINPVIENTANPAKILVDASLIINFYFNKFTILQQSMNHDSNLYGIY